MFSSAFTLRTEPVKALQLRPETAYSFTDYVPVSIARVLDAITASSGRFRYNFLSAPNAERLEGGRVEILRRHSSGSYKVIGQVAWYPRRDDSGTFVSSQLSGVWQGKRAKVSAILSEVSA